MSYDLIIIGGGPAATAGGVYAARKQLKTLLITGEFGGQSVVSPDIHNWIGTPSISGAELAKSLKTHLEEYKGEYLDIEEGMYAQHVEGTDGDFTVTSSDGKEFKAKTLLITSGAKRRTLNVPGAAEYDQKGLTYCATCDGPMFGGMDVAVVGGGNAGFESASQLLAYAKSVTLIDKNSFKADPVTIEKVLANEKMTAIKNAVTTEVLGDRMVTGLKYKDVNTGEEHTIEVQGIFVEIGMVPNTDIVKNLVELNEYKQIKVDARTQKTSAKGIWAAGDCSDGLYSQNNIAAGDAVKALEDIYVHLIT